MAIPNVAAGELIESAWGNQVGDEIDLHTTQINLLFGYASDAAAQLPARTVVFAPTTITGGGAIGAGETRKLCDVAVTDPGFAAGVVKFYVEAEASGSAGDGTLRIQVRNAAGTTVLIDGMNGSYFNGRATQHTMYGGLLISGGAYANVAVYVINTGVSVNMTGRVYTEIIPS